MIMGEAHKDVIESLRHSVFVSIGKYIKLFPFTTPERFDAQLDDSMTR